MKNVIIEIIAKSKEDAVSFTQELSKLKAVSIDLSFQPVLIKRRKRKTEFSSDTYVVRGELNETVIKEIEELPYVYKIWNDTKIDHFLCKCNSSKKGTLDDVAECIGAKQLWKKGFKGKGIVIGIVDDGVDNNILPVIGGFPNTWGTVSAPTHGNMTATDTLGIAPDAKIYDLNYTTNSGGTIIGVLSQALLAYDWASAQFDIDGTPHILSNSWGIFQEAWDADYATNPNHPFTLKVEELLDKGIKIVFAAGNCGETCPDGRCNTDTGSGRSIWVLMATKRL